MTHQKPIEALPFQEDPDWLPGYDTYHHEPRLIESSASLVNEAKDVCQNECEVIGEQDHEDYLKTYGLGPCIFLTAHRQGGLGAIHFDAGSDIALLFEDLKSRLHTSDLQGYKIRLYGGIKGMEGSEMLRQDLSEYLSKNHLKVAEDRSMNVEQEDLAYFLEQYQCMFCYQCLIVSKRTGVAFSFDPFACNEA